MISCRSTGRSATASSDGDTERALAALEKHFDDAVVSLSSKQTRGHSEGVEDR